MVDEIKTYSTKETAEILGIKERAVQTRCKKDNIRKKNNKYLITDLIIANWKQKEEANATLNANANATQLDLEIEALKIENVSLKSKIAELQKETKFDKELSADVENLKKNLLDMKLQKTRELRFLQMKNINCFKQG
jgi:predicted RNase H-like nuclease (RuvC/YqgF family)